MEAKDGASGGRSNIRESPGGGPAGIGPAWLGIVPVRPGPARLSPARPCPSRLGPAQPSSAHPAGLCPPRLGPAHPSSVYPGLALPSPARLILAQLIPAGLVPAQLCPALLSPAGLGSWLVVPGHPEWEIREPARRASIRAGRILASQTSQLRGSCAHSAPFGVFFNTGPKFIGKTLPVRQNPTLA